MTLKLTKEQKSIVKHNYQKGDVVLVNAKAGAAKTTTVIEMCKEWNESDDYESVLYLVYNAKMKVEAEAKMKKAGVDRLVEVKTTHGLAYKHVGVKYKHKLANGLLKTNIKYAMNCTWDQSQNIRDELQEFFHNSRSRSSELTKMSYMYLKRMLDVRDSSVKMVHDCYLKMFCVGLNESLGYDVIMIDEAQDSNDITMDLVLNRVGGENAVKVFVGDPNQQIYSFRGSLNIMEYIKPTLKFPLSKSFRFGVNIANLASELIGDVVVGNEAVKDQIYHELPEDFNNYTSISRTNIEVLNRAFFLSSELGLKVHFLKGFAEYSNDVVDVCNLKLNRKDMIKNGAISRRRDFEDYQSFCETADDRSGMLTCDIINKKGPYEVMQLITRLKENKVSASAADVIVTNVHTAKGLEFDNVVLSDDFHDPVKVRGAINALTYKRDKSTREEEKLVRCQEEINLLYVAVTRASKNLVLNASLGEWYTDEHIPFVEEYDEIFS